MSIIEFEAWPKIARLNRDITVTEKIDGTNAAVVIVEFDRANSGNYIPFDDPNILHSTWDSKTQRGWAVFAQSRTRFIRPGADNYGFAAWVQTNAAELVWALGPGTHFGEWWGAGIQRKYGLAEKRFSLFNTRRWTQPEEYERIQASGIRGLGVVPVLHQGIFSQAAIDSTLVSLAVAGSVAEPGFAHPEGVVVFHEAARIAFKVLLEGDDRPKGIDSALKRDQFELSTVISGEKLGGFDLAVAA